MATLRMARIGFALAVVAGLLALSNEFARYRHSGAVDWPHVVFAVGMLALFFGLFRVMTAASAKH